MPSSERRSPVVAIACFLVITACIGLVVLKSRKPADASAPAAAETAPVTGKTVAPAPAPVTLAEPLPANELPALVMVPLTPYLESSENSVRDNDEGMKRLPFGPQTYGGIDFIIDGLIHLQGVATRDEQNKTFRERVSIPVDNLIGGQSINCLHLLGGTRFSSTTPGEKFAELVWHYADGSEGRSDIKYDVDLRDWSRKRYEVPLHLPNPLVKVAWRSEHPTRKDRSLRLYRLTVVNPQPKKPLQAVEFASAMNRPSLVFIGLTLDPAKPGQRADDLTQDEWQDPELKGLVKIFVQQPDGFPADGARLRVAAQDNISKSQLLYQKYTTGADGSAEVKFPTEGLAMLEVSAEHDDYGGRIFRWDVKGGDSVPQTYTMKLGEAMKLGGIVVNEAGEAIPNASVDIYRFWTGSDEMNAKGERPNFNGSQRGIKTDAEGRWTAKGIPVEVKNRIGVSVSHKDYLSEGAHLDEDTSALQKLREGNYKTVLKQGLALAGRVVGDVNQPVPGATVALGQNYSRDKRTTKTDENGQFSLKNVPTGDQPLGVTAKGYGPSTRNVTVQKGMGELVIKLGGAHFVRGTVQDEKGSPIEGVNVQLGWSSERTYEFATKTDSTGKFNWDSAPAEPLKFSFGKQGYLYGQEKLLNPDTDNVITLKKARAVTGWVVDATTGKPVTKFRVGLGHSYNNAGGFYFNDSRSGKDVSDPNGQFTLDLQNEDSNAVRASADDYADGTESLPAGPDGDLQVTIRLKASPALRGIVVSADGTPLPGVHVAAIASGGMGGGLSISDGVIRANGSGSVSVTDSQGQFAVNSPPEEGFIIASGEAGFGRSTIAEVKASGRLVLQAYGRIEGVVSVGGQPLAGAIIRYNMDINNVWINNSGPIKANTDAQGRFTLEKIPAGSGKLIRLVQTSPNSWTHSHSTSVIVEAGKTTQVTLGESGAVIRGTVRFENPPEDVASVRVNGSIEGYFFMVKPDGTFTLDSVPPGSHQLSIRATRRRAGGQEHETDTVATGSVPVEVPEGANAYQPINVGEVVLKPNSQ